MIGGRKIRNQGEEKATERAEENEKEKEDQDVQQLGI